MHAYTSLFRGDSITYCKRANEDLIINKSYKLNRKIYSFNSEPSKSIQSKVSKFIQYKRNNYFKIKKSSLRT